ncbi:MAG: phage portal protein [Clostridia bacterium]|nr:phage portal protein [Clostridia bacterium]
MDYLGIDSMKRRLAAKQDRVELRYKYYEMKNRVKDFNITIPAKWAWLTASLGWSAKAVDSIADRLVFNEFGDDNFAINEIFSMNSKDVLIDAAILDACVASCSFIYIYADDDGYPRLQAIDAYNATGIIDPVTMLLKEGYAVLERDSDTKAPVLEAYFTSEGTTYIDSRAKASYSTTNPAPYPLLVPMVHRPDAKRPFGHSRITRACMSIQQAALRTLKRSEVAEEFFAFPQRYVTGMSQDAEQMEKWKATVSSFLQFERDDEGNSPTLGQFPQLSIAPFTEKMKLCAALFAGETGLTMDDLGFVGENPSSAEAIKASHENMRLAARKAQRTFGIGLLNAGYLAACVRDDFPYLRRQFYMTVPKWEPLFEPDAAQLSGIGDAAIKIQQSFPDYFTEEKLHDLTGI